MTAASPKFGCLMAMCPSLDADAPSWAARNVPASELAEDGVETEPYVTVLYGFDLSFDSAKLAEFFRGRRAPAVVLGEVSRFECPDYDVLKLEVESPELRELNKRLLARFDGEVTESKWPYNPHLTLAYVKKGSCRHLDGRDDFAGRSFKATQLLYSLPEKQGRVVINLPDDGGGDTSSASQGRRRSDATLRGASIRSVTGSGDILRAVRAERLARRAAAVLATAAGHKFYGNQWTESAKDPANDPAGFPSGKIKHAVLVIGGKRYKGPSHWQAFLSWAGKVGKEVSPQATGDIEHEGFQTESGHFLDREQSALYVGHHQTSLTSEEATDDHALILTSSGGRLYTADRVLKAKAGFGVSDAPSAVLAPANRRLGPLQDYEAFDSTRQQAADVVRKAVRRVVAVAEAAALKPRTEEDDSYLGGYAAAVFRSATGTAYGMAASQLAGQLSVQGGTTGSEEAEHAEERAPLLVSFPERALAKLRAEAKLADLVGDTEAEKAARVHALGDKLADGEGKTLAETEAQAACGKGQLRALKAAGYKTANWVTVGDERVRPTHTDCEAAGPVPLGRKFPNGCRYPGDPDGRPEETVNCRCWLEGAER